MEYRVLARKYRPAIFDDLIGQDVLVRTLGNAISSGRIAHAFLLTGIRGIGKTTTARIIARALNCEKGPTISPCGECSNCKMISEDRHVDVIEMDAASHTGVGDIRELIDTVRYLPSSARYKIYIIDEVHMLSTSAFNALLKTLEEPPPHVKFIFATTESRKIPVTILSRCQRFDLKRIDMETLAAHLARIAAKENVTAEEAALKLISVAAEGSVRDALSLLDQAIARDGGNITVASVRQMMGAADNTATFRLLEILLGGNIAEALTEIRQQYTNGADPLLILQDALEITHLVTRVKVAPQALADVSLSEHDRTSAQSLAERLTMPVLTRLWQMLIKGINEVRMSPLPMSALDMLLVRIAYAAQLPTPAEVIRSESQATPAVAAAPAPVTPERSYALAENPAPKWEGQSVKDFNGAVALFEQNKELILANQLKTATRLVSFEPGKIELRLSPQLPRDFLGKASECLTRWTGQPWKVLSSEAEGQSTLKEQETARKEKQLQEAQTHPLVSSILEQFPGAKIVNVKENA
jgi:DNA polymerase-3 subunit gamma/tau